MAAITVTDKFFGLEPASWLEAYYTDKFPVNGQLRIRDRDTGERPLIPLEDVNNEDGAWKLTVSYEEVLVTATTTTIPASTRGGEATETINISSVTRVTPEQMPFKDPDDESQGRESNNGTLTVTIEAQNVPANVGIFQFEPPETKQNNPPFSSPTLPGHIIWLTVERGSASYSRVGYGIFYRPGPSA